jgi:hypothetical protein
MFCILLVIFVHAIAAAVSPAGVVNLLSAQWGCRSRSLPRNALYAQPPKYQLTLSKHPFPKGINAGLRHIVPIHVVNAAAAVADEVMMARALCIETSGATLDRDFTHQPRFNEVPKVVVSCRP